MDVGHMLRERGPKHKKCKTRGIKIVKLKYSANKELYEEMRFMVEKNITVKEKKVKQRKFSAKRNCMAKTIYVVTIGAEVLCFLDTPTKIEKLTEQNYYKLNPRVKQILFGMMRQKLDAINMKKHLKEFAEDERKISLDSYQFMSYWTEKFQNNPHLKKLVMNLIQKVCDKEILSKESLNLVSEIMFLKNVCMLKAASYQCEFSSCKKMCIQHFPFKFEGVSCNFGFSGQESQIFNILHQELDLERETFKINNFEYLIIRKDFNLIVSIISKEPSFRYLIPPFIKYLQSDHAYDSSLKCLHLISIIFSCSYNPFSDKQHLYEVMNYMCYCLLNTTISIWDGYYTCQKIGTIVNKIGNKFFPVQKAILEELKKILNDPFISYDSCLGILVAMRSMEFVSVGEILFDVFEKMAAFADKKVRDDFYFLLLDVCEIFVTKVIESESESTSQNDLRVASKCLNFFKEDLSLRLTPVFNRYKARMFKEKNNFKKYKVTMGEGLDDTNTFFQKSIENPPKVKDEKVPDYPRRTKYCKCDYSLDCFYPDEKLSGSEKSGGNDKEESSDDEYFGYVEKLSDEEGSNEAASCERRQKCKYFRLLREFPKYYLDYKNIISSYAEKGKDEKLCTGNLSLFV